MKKQLRTRSPFYAQFESLPAEVASENFATYTEDVSLWSKVGVDITTDDITAPDGTTTADKVARNTTSAAYVSRNGTKPVASNTRVALSMYVKQGDSEFVSIRIQGSYSNRIDFQYKFGDTPTIVRQSSHGTASLVNRTVEYINDGWFRFGFVADLDTGSTAQIMVSPKNDENENVDSSDASSTAYLYAWGAQLEVQDEITSYIPNLSTGTSSRAETLVANEQQVTCSLYIYEGDVVNDIPLTPNYVLRSFPTDGLTTFEISELVRDYIKQTSATSSGTVYAMVSMSDGVRFNREATYLAQEGYTTNNDLIQYDVVTSIAGSLTGFQFLSQSNTSVYIPEGMTINVPFYASEDVSYVIDGVTTTLTDSTDSASQIQYIELGSTDLELQIKKDGSTFATIDVIEADCTKYGKHMLTFVNKYGAKQDFYVQMKSTTEIKAEDKTHTVNTIDFSDFNAGLQKHNVKRRITGSKVAHTLNTGFINEDNAEVLEELLVSEYVWLKMNNAYRPVILKDSSVTRKTHLNDKLIQYTIKVEETSPYLANLR